MIQNRCPICNSEETELKLTLKDYLIHKDDPEVFSVFFCNKCSNGFTYPFMTNEELSRFYPDDYGCYKNHKSITGYIQRIKSENDVRIISKLLKGTGLEIFEIGAGSGFFLSVLKKKGFKVSGIEPGASGVRYAKDNFNIELDNLYFEDLRTDKRYDMIIAFHVLEHFNDPVAMINKMKNMLKPEGRIFIKVPRLDSWPSKLYSGFWHGYDVPRHRFHFTGKGLKKILISSGLKIDIMKSDLGPLDTIRAVRYFSVFSRSPFLRFCFKALDHIPYMIKLFMAVILDIIMSPFKSGRMSIVAGKKGI